MPIVKPIYRDELLEAPPLDTEEGLPVYYIALEGKGRRVQELDIKGETWYLGTVMGGGDRAKYPMILLTKTELKPGDRVAYKKNEDGSILIRKLKISLE